MEVQEKRMVKCQICGKEYIFDESQIIKMNGVKGIYCTDSCGSFIAIDEREEIVQNHERTRCKKCSTPLHLSDVEDSVLECPHCHEKMTFPKEGQTQDVIDLLNQGQRELSICNFDDAYKHFHEATLLDPREPEAYFGKLLSEYNIQYLRDFAHYKEDGTITLQPICHRENLQSIKDDQNYKKALEYASDEQRKIYGRKIKDILDIDYHFKMLENEGADYDCFICVKVKEEDKEHYTKDSHYANKLYDKLIKNGYHPFYSERSKEEENWLGNAYEANILYGLYKAKCMIIICSNKEYLDTPWVKNEYSRYIEFMRIGKKKEGSLCITYTDDIIEKLPGLSYRLEGIKFTEFDASEKLLGFVQKFCRSQEQTTHQIDSKNNDGISLQNRGTQIDKETIYHEKVPQKQVEEQRKDKSSSIKPKLQEAKKNQVKDIAHEGIPNVKYEIKGNTATITGCDKDITNLIIPSTIKHNGKEYPVTSIENNAFCEYSSLASIVIPNSVKSIGNHAFSGCHSLTSIIIPSSVTSIGEYAFFGCISLASITFEEGIKIKNIEFRAFSYCQSLTTIVIPKSVKWIGYQAFCGCSSLSTVTFEEESKLITMRWSVFQECSSLASIVMPRSVTSIGQNAFLLCSSLSSIVIPSSVTSIGYRAFQDCSSLTIYCEASSKLSRWKSTWNFSNRPVYWAGQWSYVNGAATPNQK